MTTYNNFTEVVKAAGPDDNPTRVVKIANPEDLNPIRVDELPAASADNKGLIYWLSTDNTLYQVNAAGDDYTAIGSGGGGGAWGEITGTLSDQEDLQDALDLKADASDVTDALALKADTATVNTALAAKQVAQTGLLDSSQYAITYSAAERQFTVVNSGTTVSVLGNVQTPGNETTAAHADTSGTWWAVYAAGDTTLTVTQTPDFAAQAIVGRAVYNATTTAGQEYEERHTRAMSAIEHGYLHRTVGARLVTAPLGCTASSYTLQPAVPANANNQPALAAGVIYDEDIPVSVTAVTAGTYSLARRSGADADGEMTVTDGAAVPFTAGTYIQYNDLTGGNWVLTDAGSGDCVNVFAFATTRKGSVQVLWLIGEAVHANLAAALTEAPGDLQLITSIRPEAVPLYRFTFCANASYTTTGKCRVEAVTDYRGQVSGAQVVSSSATDHNSLVNRSAVASHPATAVSYDGSIAGLDATTTQAAIDEIIADGEGAANAWQTIYTDGTGLTPSDTNTVPYTGTGIEAGMGVRCTYDDGGGDDFYYGVVSAVSALTSFDTYLAIFNTSYAVTKIEVCNASALTEILLHAPGLYAGAAHDDIFTDWGTPIVTGKAFAVGRVYAKQGTDDSAATTTEPAYNVNIGGTSNNIFSADVELTTSFADAIVAPSFTHYTAAAGEVIDVKIAQATGGTPGHDATNLSVLIVGVPL